MDLSTLSPEAKRRLLAELLEKPDPHLTETQLTMWIGQVMSPDSAAGHVAMVIRLPAEVDPQRLRDRLQKLCERHHVLQTFYPEQDGRPVAQRSDKPLDFQVMDGTVEDARRAVYTPFRPLEAPPIRVRMLREADGRHVLVVVSHHMVLDMIGFTVLWAEATARSSRDWPALTTRFGDYVRWERRSLDGPEGVEQRRYWEARLAAAAPALFPSGPAGATRLASFHLGPELTGAVQGVARRTGVTLCAALLTALQVLIARRADRTTFWMVTPSSGRVRREFESVVGCLTSSIPLLARLRGGQTWRQALQQVHDDLQESTDFQNWPLVRMEEFYRNRHGVPRTPLTDVMFNWVASRIGALQRHVHWDEPAVQTTTQGLSVEVLYACYTEGENEKLSLTMFNSLPDVSGILGAVLVG